MKRCYQSWLVFTKLCLMGMMCMTEARAEHRQTKANGNSSGQCTSHRLVSLFTEHLASANFQLLTLLRQRHVAFETILEPELNKTLLTPRRPLFIHTLDLPHDEVMQKRHYFELFVRASALAPSAP